MADLKQQMIDHMNDHWSSNPPLEGQVEPGHDVDPQSPYGQWSAGHDRDLAIAHELLGDDLMWDNDNNRWVVR